LVGFDDLSAVRLFHMRLVAESSTTGAGPLSGTGRSGRVRSGRS
jgi:hypothetical protein